MIICSRVRSSDYHYSVAGCATGGGVVDAVVVYGGLEEVGIGFEPGGC